MKLLEVIRYELLFQLRRQETWVYFIVILGLSFMTIEDIMIEGAQRGSGNLAANSPYLITSAMIYISTIAVFFTAILAGSASAREEFSNIAQLWYTLPIKKMDYMGGRFLGLLIINSLIFFAVPGGLLMVEFIYSGSSLLQEFRMINYLVPYLVFVWPNLVITSAILFSITFLTKKYLTAYLGAFLLVVISFVSIELNNSNGSGFISFLNSFGLIAYENLTQYWITDEKNKILTWFEGDILWNRVVWASAALVLLVVTYKKSKFRIFNSTGYSERGKISPAPHENQNSSQIRIFYPGKFGLITEYLQVVSISRYHFFKIISSPFFLVMVGAVILHLILSGWNSFSNMGTPSLPITYVILKDIIVDLQFLVCFLITIYTGELLWKERETNISYITDTLPVNNNIFLLGKFFAVLLMIIMVQFSFMVGGIVVQILRGFYDFNLWLYLEVLFGIQLLDYTLWVALAFCLHTLINHKNLGHLIFVAYFLFFTYGADNLGIEHNLSLYPSAPEWRHSDLSGYGPFLAPFLWFKFYWLLWALLFLLFANIFWNRGNESKLRLKIKSASVQKRKVKWQFTIVITAILFTGSFLFYNTNVLNDFDPLTERIEDRIQYEKKYKKFESIAQPTVTGVSLNVDLKPEKRNVKIQAEYSLVNKTSEVIDTLLIVCDSKYSTELIELSSSYKILIEDNDIGTKLILLENPLRPKESLKAIFLLKGEEKGFSNNNPFSEVVGNGTFIREESFPDFGYQPPLEIADLDTREKYSMPEQEPIASVENEEAKKTGFGSSDSDWIDFEAFIWTGENQTAVAPGRLVKKLKKDSRNFFHYKSNQPIRNFFGIFSGEYKVRQEIWNDVSIDILYHPKHHRNLSRILSGAKASLEYHSTYLGSYPFEKLTIVEFPRHEGNFARSYPGLIAFSESMGFLSDVEEGIDYPFLVAAHEVAHQWWGNQLSAANVEGASFIKESLAHYGAVMSLKAKYKDQAGKSVDIMSHDYLSERGSEGKLELPLWKTGFNQSVAYNKGAVSMTTLVEYVGEEKVNTALRNFFTSYRFKDAPYPTTKELNMAIRSVTPDSLQYLITDLFLDITWWDMKILAAEVSYVEDEMYNTKIRVGGSKFKTRSNGTTEEVEINDLVEIAIYGIPEDEDMEEGRLLYLKKHRINGEMELELLLNEKPKIVVVDPFFLLLDRDTKNNVYELNNFENTESE